jgi:DNA-binding transcriptional ArsR family regulator
MSFPDTITKLNTNKNGYLTYYSLFRKCLIDIRTINNGIRHDLINLIFRGKEICVTDMYVKLRLEQSVVSQHLAALKTLNFISFRRSGKNIYYSLNIDVIQRNLDFINNLTESDGAHITDQGIDFGEVNFAFEILRVLSHDLRLLIIDTIVNNDNNINVNSIYTSLKIEQSITSQHLKMIRDIKLCETHKKGKNIFYSIHLDKLERIKNNIKAFYNS